MNITTLYPQYQRTQDRRQQTIPVAIDRRSGVDRRNQNRVQLDSQLQRDIFEVKNKVIKFESMAPKLFEQSVTTNAPTFSSMNNMTQDVLVKQAKPDPTAIARQEAKLNEKASTAFKIGVISASLAGAIVLCSMSTVGAVIAIGTGVYIGAKVLKSLITKEINSDNSTKKVK